MTSKRRRERRHQATIDLTLRRREATIRPMQPIMLTSAMEVGSGTAVKILASSKVVATIRLSMILFPSVLLFIRKLNALMLAGFTADASDIEVELTLVGFNQSVEVPVEKS